MAPLAVYLRQFGYRVCGYDDNLSHSVCKLLEEANIEILASPELPKGVDRVVYSSAIRPSHPIYAQASAQGIPLIRRGVMLAEVVRDKNLIAVVGSHGKTTTTGMLICALEQSGLSFSYIMGGLFEDERFPPARYSESEWIIAEIDESDGTIDGFSPEVTLAVNLDWDHPDFYKSAEDMRNTFRSLFERTHGVVLYPAADSSLEELVAGISAQKTSFGSSGDYELISVDYHGNELELELGGRFEVSPVSVKAKGDFNAINAVAALAVVSSINCGTSRDCLSGFPGIRRRQTVLHDINELTVLEDYAHHPKEIEALLGFCRKSYSGRKLAVVFQPHRYSRTLEYKEQFADVLSKADALFLMDVYPAGESEIEGGTSNELFELFPAFPPAEKVDSFVQLKESLDTYLKKPSVVLFAGAGDIDHWASAYVSSLTSRSPEIAKSEFEGIAEPDWLRALEGGVNPDTCLLRNEPLADKTTLRVGGAARYYAEPASIKDLTLLLDSAARHGQNVFFLGRGSNVIVPDDGFDGLVIRLNHPSWREMCSLGKGRIRAGAGVRLKQLCGEACRLGLAGFEFLEGIPGSLGGALRMNAGAMGGWIFDVVEEVSYVTLKGELLTRKRSEFHTGYRICHELTEAVAVSAVVTAPREAPVLEIKQKLEEFSIQRKSSQPREPSAGCIFKNPEHGFAGQLIDELGLKGMRFGEARVSDVHGNFIINCGGASSRDVITLIKNVRQEVRQRKGIELEPEVLLLGRQWEQEL